MADVSPRGDTCRPTVGDVLKVVDRQFPGERLEIDLGRVLVHATVVLHRVRLIQIATLKARIMLMRNEMALAFPRFPIVVSVVRR